MAWFFQGGVAYFKDGQVRASYTAADGLGEGRVNDFRLDQDGTLWAATEGGLSRLKNGRVATLTSKNGLPCDAVHWVDGRRRPFVLAVHGLRPGAHCAHRVGCLGRRGGPGQDAKRTIQATVFDSSDGVRLHAHTGGYTPMSPSPRMESCGSRLWMASASSIRATCPSTSFRRRCTSSRSPPTARPTMRSDAADLRLPPLSTRSGDRLHGAQLRRAGEGALSYKLEGRIATGRTWALAGRRSTTIFLHATTASA